MKLTPLSLPILLLTALNAIGPAAHGQSNVYTLNVVGYVNAAVSPGLNLIANPLRNANNNANLIMPGVPDGSVLFRFDPLTQQYVNAATFFTGVGWYPLSGNTNDPVLILNVGEGFFIHVPQANTITFVGEVLQGSLTNPIPANFSLKASMVPQAGLLQTALMFPPVQDDYIWRWNASSQSYAASSPHYYDSSAWDPSEPEINVAEGFIVHRDPALATPDNWWIRNFSVNRPAGDSTPRSSSDPAIVGIKINGGTVTLTIHNPNALAYDVQFSTDRLTWQTVDAKLTGTTWTGPNPGGARGYYQLANP